MFLVTIRIVVYNNSSSTGWLLLYFISFHSYNTMVGLAMANDTSSIEVRTNQVRSVFGSIPNCIQFHNLVQSATNELWISVINRLLPFFK